MWSRHRSRILAALLTVSRAINEQTAHDDTERTHEHLTEVMILSRTKHALLINVICFFVHHIIIKIRRCRYFYLIYNYKFLLPFFFF